MFLPIRKEKDLPDTEFLRKLRQKNSLDVRNGIVNKRNLVKEVKAAMSAFPLMH